MMLAQAIQYIDNSTDSFSIRVVKYNAKTGEGGDFLTLQNCIKAENFNRKKSEPLGPKKPRNTDLNAIYRDPKHYENATRNLLQLQKVAHSFQSTGSVKKIHIWLITELNGHKIKM